MTQVSRSRSFGVSPDEMWGRIGDFQSVDSWHPAIAGSVAREPMVRELTLQDGATIVETMTDESPRSYAYRIDESPLPVREYSARIAVREGAGDGCEVVWDAEFEPEGASAEEASAIVGHIFDAGLGNL